MLFSMGQFSVTLFDRKIGGNLLTIVGGHNLDAFTYMLGDFTELSAVTAQQFPEVELADIHKFIKKTTDDQILITGKLTNGAAASIHIQGGVKHQTGLILEIFGDFVEDQIFVNIVGDDHLYLCCIFMLATLCHLCRQLCVIVQL